MLRKMVMMRMLIGNMRRPLSIPTMISCQVISSEPRKEKKSAVSVIRNNQKPDPVTIIVSQRIQHIGFMAILNLSDKGTLVKGLYAICSVSHSILWSI